MKRDPITNEQLCALAKQGDADAQNLLIENNLRFDDDTEHPLTETAKHFNLSVSRAKKTEAQALDNVWLELPWWYEQRRTFLLASIIEAWIAVSKMIDEMMDE